jgi:hypothetical protein
MVFYSGVVETEEASEEDPNNQLGQMMEEVGVKTPSDLKNGIPKINLSKKTPKKLPPVSTNELSNSNLRSSQNSKAKEKSYL